MMKMSEKGITLLAQWEGYERHLYHDVIGMPTIGVGHLLSRDELTSGKIDIKGVAIEYANGLTDQQVTDLLAQDLSKFEHAANDNVTVNLQQKQFDTLVSFTFNMGTEAFKNSTLLKVLNQGKYEEVPDQLRRWVYAGGRKVRGLVNRRENEIKLWDGEI